ncbi:MAG: hypothetical protein AB1498_07860 [bacterium]
MKYFINLILINTINNINNGFNEGDIRDIKPIIEYDLKYMYLLMVLLLTAFVFAVILLIRKKSDAGKREEVILPPDVAAMDKIRKLKESKLIEQGKIKEFYTIISDIIRVFFEQRYKISALDQTSYELIWELKNKNLIDNKAEIVRDFLYDCDLVKFAKYVPPAEDSDRMLNTAEGIINFAKNDPVKNPAEIKTDV